MTKKIKNQIMGVKEVAKELGLSVKKVQTLCRENKLSSIKTNAGWLIERHSLELFKDNPKGKITDEPKTRKPNNQTEIDEALSAINVPGLYAVLFLETGNNKVLLKESKIDPFVSNHESLAQALGGLHKDFTLHLCFQPDGCRIFATYDVEKYTSVDRLLLHETLLKYGVSLVHGLEILTENFCAFAQKELQMGLVEFDIVVVAKQAEIEMVFDDLVSTLKEQFNLTNLNAEKKKEEQDESGFTMKAPKEIQ